jgi:FSR family fosmidomycin resistance protein-like MFS transporter
MARNSSARSLFAGAGIILPVFILAHFAHHLATGALTPLLPMLRDDLKLTYFDVGVLTGAFTLTYSIMQIPAAAAGNRYSRRKLIVIGLIGAGVGSMLVGLADGYWTLVAALVVIGAFGSTYHALASAFLSFTFSQANRGRSLGMHTIGGSGSLLVTPVVAVLVAAYFGTWRAAFVVLGIVPIVVGFVLLVAAREQEAAHLKAFTAAVGERLTLTEIGRLIGLLIVIAAVGGMLQMAVMSFLPLYLVDKHSVSKELAGIVSGLVAGGGIIGAPLGGALSDRFSRRPIIILSLVVAGPLLYLLTLLPFGLPMLVLITVYGMALSMRMPVMESVIADVVPPMQRGTALGIYFFFTQETTAVLSPVIGGLIDSYGPDPTFVGLAIVGLATAGVAMLIRGSRPARTSNQPAGT